jgi:hypothetical protein
MVATRKYKETMTCRLTEGRPDSVLYAEDSGFRLISNGSGASLSASPISAIVAPTGNHLL